MAFTGIPGAAQWGSFVPGAGALSSPLNQNPSNTLTFNQTVTGGRVLNDSASNTLSFTQTVKRVFIGTASNTLTLTPSTSALRVTPASNTLTFTQSTIVESRLFKIINQSVSFGQFVPVNKTLNINLNQSLTFTQFAARTIIDSGSNTITFTPTTSATKIKNGIASNTLTFSQTLTKSVVLNRSTSNGINFTNTITLNKILNVPVSNTLFFVSTCNAWRAIGNTLTFTPSVTVIQIRTTSNFLTLSQPTVVRQMIYNKSFGNSLGMLQIVTKTLSTSRSVNNSLSFSQTLTAEKVRSTSNTLTLSQILTSEVCKLTGDELVFVEEVIVNNTFNVTIRQVVLFFNQLSEATTNNRSVSNHLDLLQIARAFKVKIGEASNTLTFSHVAHHNTSIESITQTLDLDQSVVVVPVHIKATNNTLTFSQTVNVAKVYNRTATNDLIFYHTRQRNGFTLDAAQVYTAQRCVFLRSEGNAIALPKPDFNDTNALKVGVLIKRSRDGTRRTYTKANKSESLVYTFTISQLKGLELKDFINNSFNKQIMLTNWKGETWLVNFINNPFQFQTPGRYGPIGTLRERNTVTLEFEGKQI